MLFTGDLRPCLVRGQRGLFHGWGSFDKGFVDASGKIVRRMHTVNAVVELESGEMITVMPEAVRFTDSAAKFASVWGDAE